MAIGGARRALPLARFFLPGAGLAKLRNLDGPMDKTEGFWRLGGLVQLWCGSNEPENVLRVDSEEYLLSAFHRGEYTVKGT